MLKTLAAVTPRSVKDLANQYLPGIYQGIVTAGMQAGDMRAVSPVVSSSHTDLPDGEVEMPSEYRQRHAHEVVSFLNDHLERLGLHRAVTANTLESFRASMDTNPARGIRGGTGYNSLLWLFAVTSALAPEIVVESGVYVGSSLWTLRRSAPDARLVAFDVNLRKLTFSDDSIEFVEADWAGTKLDASSPGDLCYFDDHVDNALRIVQAAQRGFKHLVFDDCASLANLVHYRYPGVPSARMLVDGALADGQTFRWMWQGEALEYTYREEDVREARALVEEVVAFPGLKELTAHGDTHDFYYVRLR